MAKRKAVSKQDKILKAIGGLTEVVQQLVNMEVSRHGKTDHGVDGRKGVQPVSSVRAHVAQVGTGAPVARRAGEDTSSRRDVDAGAEARRRAQEADLNQGVENAVSSYRPANDPLGVPARVMQVKTLYEADQDILCSDCKEKIYVTAEEVTTAHTLADLPRLLLPYSDGIPQLTAETPVNTKAGTRLPCPRCMSEWGVVIL